MREALRCLRRGGMVVISDTAWYSREESGRKMVSERHAAYLQKYGTASDSIRSLEFLTDERLRALEEQLSIRWTVVTPRYGLKWALRPWIAHVRGAGASLHGFGSIPRGKMHDGGAISRHVRRTVIHGARCAFGQGISRRATIQISDGRVTGIGAERHLTSPAKPGYCEIDLGGFLVMPGFINTHDHLQFALHPRLADPPYRNYVDWGEGTSTLSFRRVFAKHRSVP